MKRSTKVVVFIIILTLIAFGINAAKKAHENAQTNTITTDIPNPLKLFNTFNGVTFDKKPFIFNYPAEGSFNTTGWDIAPWRVGGQTTDGGGLAAIAIPASIQPNTNFRGAIFMLGAGSTSNAVKDCLIATNGEIEVGNLTINGVVYKKFTLSNAGAGNFYETTSYRTVRDNSCYAVEYTIHTTNIANYSPDQGIKEYDKASVTKILEDMVQSFKFI